MDFKKWLFLISLSALLFAGQADALTVKSEKLQTAATANGNGTASVIQGYTAAVVQVAGTFSATVNFEASVDGTNYTAIQCFSIADRVESATSVTTAGAWRCNVVGTNSFRARVSAYASGSVTVSATFISAGVF